MNADYTFAFARWLLNALAKDNKDPKYGISGVTIFCHPGREKEVGSFFEKSFRENWRYAMITAGQTAGVHGEEGVPCSIRKVDSAGKKGRVSFFLGDLTIYENSGEDVSMDAGDVAVQNALDETQETFDGITYEGLACYTSALHGDVWTEVYEIIDGIETNGPYDFLVKPLEEALNKCKSDLIISLQEKLPDEVKEIRQVLKTYRKKITGSCRAYLDEVLKAADEVIS